MLNTIKSIFKRIKDNRILVRGIKVFVFAGIAAVITYALELLPGVDLSPELKAFLISSLTSIQAMFNKSYRIQKAS